MRQGSSQSSRAEVVDGNEEEQGRLGGKNDRLGHN